MYLFDTDAITNILKKKPSEKLVKNISGLKREDQFITTITIGEIVYGSFKSGNPQCHLNNLRNILLPAVNILSFDSQAAFIYGKTRAGPENSGDIISHADVQIASIAIANNLTLITGNIKHFIKIPQLKIEDWIN